ncbi:MAG: hypothetical protein K0B00_12525 [Rhodobacteraceae bacterium]|nr:hypothetical protein [Paracoccaceae bacterium]
MWQTGRASDRNLDRASPSHEAPRKNSLPPLQPAPSELAERVRGVGVVAGKAARWALLLLAVILAGVLVAQNPELRQIRVPGSAAIWLEVAAALAVMATAMRLRGKIASGLRALRGGTARAQMDPFARLAADTRAQKTARH